LAGVAYFAEKLLDYEMALMWVIGNGQQPDVMQLLTLGFSIRNPTEKI
jgi:hypothetical protein